MALGMIWGGIEVALIVTNCLRIEVDTIHSLSCGGKGGGRKEDSPFQRGLIFQTSLIIEI